LTQIFTLDTNIAVACCNSNASAIASGLLGRGNAKRRNDHVVACSRCDQLDRQGRGNFRERFLAAAGGIAVAATFGALASATPAPAQTAGDAAQPKPGSQLPPIQVTAPETKHNANSAPARADRGGQRRRAQTARRPDQPPAAKPFAVTQDARTGTTGYYSDSTGVATKTNTPLINVPQSVAVLTKDFIQDQGTHSITDLSRYVPGVVVHQGEGNRDELIIRGVDSSANFFVNGFRDDVQYYRDIYNHPEHRGVERPERAGVRTWRGWRRRQSHAQGG
jgi:outer membrane receptor protein involved in Fe transport